MESRSLHHIKTHFDAYKVVRMASYNTVRDECVFIWSHSIMVSIAACHAVDRSSILLGTAKIINKINKKELIL